MLNVRRQSPSVVPAVTTSFSPRTIARSASLTAAPVVSRTCTRTVVVGGAPCAPTTAAIHKLLTTTKMLFRILTKRSRQLRRHAARRSTLDARRPTPAARRPPPAALVLRQITLQLPRTHL